MSRARAALLLLVAGAWGGAPAAAAERPGGPGPAVRLAQIPRLPPAGPRGEERPPAPHRTGELDCRQCHEGRHQGIVRMYLGMGGRGTPMIPSHMFQVRVECVACHVTPKEAGERAGVVGQTFTPSEQACLGCHGERYRGMLDRWKTTLARMQEIMAPKLAAARAAVAGDAREGRLARARQLVDDAEFNARFVALARGVHNVFYAADLLSLANGWVDEALRLAGKSPPRLDDALVRGGYCGVLCHEQAGVRLPDTVAFGKQRVPHARHVTEFGAVCTACHSAEVHKAVTATPATCTGCHHGPQSERCESCHRVQSAFYRGQAKAPVALEADRMAQAVGCTGCHDLSKKHSPRAVGDKCVGCHDAAYAAFAEEWTTGLRKAAAETETVVRRAEAALARQRRAGRAEPAAQALVSEARQALDLVQKARGAHNPAAAESLLEAARKRAETALGTLAGAGRR